MLCVNEHSKRQKKNPANIRISTTKIMMGLEGGDGGGGLYDAEGLSIVKHSMLL